MTAQKSSFTYDELIACAKGDMFGPGNAQLPLPPMLMFDRITHVSDQGGAHDKGYLTAELDLTPQHWFFPCHFEGDPVMPGCLGLDAMWQLVGFFLGWGGSPGKGRALGVGEVKFRGQVTQDAKVLTYRIDIRRVVRRSLVLGVGDGVMSADGEPIYSAKDLRVGLFAEDQL